MLAFVKRYSDTKQAGRIDAEYYQPHYEEMVAAIKDYQDGWDRLGNLISLKDSKYEPEAKRHYRYIELSNIVADGEIADCMREEGHKLPTRARRKVALGDVIVSSIEGSLLRIAMIQEAHDKAVCSTGFYVINSKRINSETLLVLLKSRLGQLQLKKGCSGTILTAINKDEFCRMVLPKLSERVQSLIQEKVTEAFELRNQARLLLECAKQAVEMAIEKDEQAAVECLENRTPSENIKK